MHFVCFHLIQKGLFPKKILKELWHLSANLWVLFNLTQTSSFFHFFFLFFPLLFHSFISIFFPPNEDKKKINANEYASIALQHQNFIQSLGLISQEKQSSLSISTQSESEQNMETNLQQLLQESTEEKKKKGIPITFGHSSWDLSYHMMLGIRIAVILCSFYLVFISLLGSRSNFCAEKESKKN